MMGQSRSLPLTLLLVLAWTLSAYAQKAPQLGYMYPPVLKTGATNEVQLGGYDFTPDMQWFFYGEGIELLQASSPGEYIITPPPYWTGPRLSLGNPLIAREVTAKIQVAETSPTGLRYFQAANANGIAQTAAYLLRAGNEVVESRWRDEPQDLGVVPVGISGRLSRLTEVDRYCFTAQHDGLVFVELHARRLGGNFNAILKVEDNQQRCLVDVSDTLGTDCRFVFPAQKGVPYKLSLHDADFRGDASYVYHLAIEDRPIIERCYPAKIAPGKRAEIEFIGWGLASGAAKLESLKQMIEVPSDCAAPAWKQTIDTALGRAEIEIPISQQPEPLIHASPGDAMEGSFVVSKIFNSSEKEHRYRWKVPAMTSWELELETLRFGSDLDLELSVLDSMGKVLAASEDSAGTMDPAIVYTSNSDAEVTLVIRRFTSAEEELANRYVLQVRPQVCDFSLTMEQAIPVVVGGKKEWNIKAERRGGHDAEITLDIFGVPEGVSIQGEKKIAAGKNEVKLTFEVTPTAKVAAVPLRVSGESNVEGQVVRRDAFATASKVIAPLKLEHKQISAALMGITMSPPFDIFLLDKTRQRDTPRGATCVAEMDIVRKDGFEGEIVLEMAAQQSRYLCGSYGLSVKVPPGVKRVEYGAWMSEWLGTEYTMRMATHGVAQVADPQGNLRYLIKATDAPITMIMEGAILKVASEPTILRAKLGERVAMPVKISRSPKLAEVVSVRVDIPSEIRALCQGAEVRLAANESETELIVQLPDDPRLLGHWQIPIRAMSHLSGWPVQAFCQIELRVEPTPPSRVP